MAKKASEHCILGASTQMKTHFKSLYICIQYRVSRRQNMYSAHIHTYQKAVTSQVPLVLYNELEVYADLAPMQLG